MKILESIISIEWVSTIAASVYMKMKAVNLYKDLRNSGVVEVISPWSSDLSDLKSLKSNTTNNVIKEKANRIIRYLKLCRAILIYGCLIALALGVFSWICF